MSEQKVEIIESLQKQSRQLQKMKAIRIGMNETINLFNKIYEIKDEQKQ